MQLYPLLFEPNLHTVVWGGNRLIPYKGINEQLLPAGITADSRMHTCAVEIDSPLLDGYRSEAMLMPFRGADGRDYVYIYIDYYPIYVHTVGDLRITGDFKEQEHM